MLSHFPFLGRRELNVPARIKVKLIPMAKKKRRVPPFNTSALVAAIMRIEPRAGEVQGDITSPEIAPIKKSIKNEVGFVLF